jgi:hypothetical protein
MKEAMDHNEEIQIKKIKKVQEIDIILNDTKRPVFIYTYNKLNSNQYKREVQKHFKDLSTEYEGRITFLQIDESDQVMPEVFRKGAQNFAGFYNKQIFGPIPIDENSIEKMDALLVDLASKKLKNFLFIKFYSRTSS